jgi:membrane-associated phospholipid phosphatase
MTIGAGILLIAVGAILRFGISTVSTHGFGVHTIGDILMGVGVLGIVLWLLVWAPWAPRARSRRTVYREEVPPREVPPRRRYPADRIYEDEYEDEYRR